LRHPPKTGPSYTERTNIISDSTVSGCTFQNAGFKIQDAGCRIQDSGCRMEIADTAADWTVEGFKLLIEVAVLKFVI
jgi:hypothetical protein